MLRNVCQLQSSYDVHKTSDIMVLEINITCYDCCC